MRTGFGLFPSLTLAVLILSTHLGAVRSESDRSAICLAEGEHIYSSTDNEVKMPKLHIEESKRREVSPKSPVEFEIILNPAGRLCEIHVLKAPDRDTAKQLAYRVGDYFRFSPATRKGKPVAIRFRIVFESDGHLSVEK